jgi:hypothetical protein
LKAVGLTPEGPYATQLQDKSGQKVCIVQAWQYSYAIGKLNVDFDKYGNVSACTGQPMILVSDSYKDSKTGTSAASSTADAAAYTAALKQVGAFRITTPLAATTTALKNFSDAKVALGDPKSWINNPNITGKSVTSANQVATDSGKGLTATPKETTLAGANTVTPGGNNTLADKLKTAISGGTKADGTKGMDPMAMMMLMMLLSQMGKGGGGSSQAASIPQLSASRSQLPYTAPSRPGAGGTTYFSPTTYAPRAAGGGMVGYAGGGGISSLGGYSDGGRLLKGPGDGVSDNIPATIAGKQPARLANGEFVVPARIVSELGNGSTDAGAKRLYEMMDRVQKARRKTKNVAADTKARKYLPA